MKPIGATKEATGRSPLPWRWLPDEGQFIVDAKGNIVAEIPCQGCNPIDGELIVTAVNERERLREALRLARGFASEATWGPRSAHSRKAEWLVKQIDAALNEVEG